MGIQELSDLLLTIQEEINLARQKCDKYRKLLNDAESELLYAKLRFERSSEELRKLKASDINQPFTLREIDIAKFKEKLPELLKKIK